MWRALQRLHLRPICRPARLQPSPALSLPPGKIADDYPWLVETGVLDVVLPKKQDLVLVKL
jgi:hypothetical protein